MRSPEHNLGRGATLVQGDSWTRWLHEIRAIEFAGTMRHIPVGRSSTVLELGCGDGFQLDLLRERFERVFAVDPEDIPESTQGFAKCVAEALPFRDRSFDLVISSNVTEHLTDRERAMQEVRRVLRPGGYAAHIVPTRTWKLTSLVLNPLGYPLRVMEKRQARRRMLNNTGKSSRVRPDPVPAPGALQILRRWVWPPVHGTFSSHLAEYRSYGRRQWMQTFALEGFKFIAEAPLLFYTQFGLGRFRMLPARAWAAQHGFSGARAFIFRREPAASGD